LADFNDYFNTDYVNEDVETLGGYLLGHIGHLPERGESITLDQLTFKVLDADSRHIHLYQVVDDRS
jgi:magnesium and cobalt transporter